MSDAKLVSSANVVSSIKPPAVYGQSLPAQLQLLRTKTMPQKIISWAQTKLRTVRETMISIPSTITHFTPSKNPAQFNSQALTSSPAQCLPGDILYEIFFAYMDNSPIPFCDDDLNYRNPWILSQVCRSWREVALSVHSLWSHFTIQARRYQIDEDKCYHRLLSCLERSENCPLLFHTDLFSGFGQRFYQHLISHAHRWQDVQITLSRHTELDYLDKAKGNFQNLRRLTIFANHFRVNAFDYFSHAPSLSELSLIYVLSPTTRMTIPWSQLTKLTLGGVTLDRGELSTILSKTINIAEFYWMGPYLRGQEGIALESLVLPHLRVLKVQGAREDYESILGSLTAPRLQNLHIASTGGHLLGVHPWSTNDQDIVPKVVIHFLERHSYPLTELSVDFLGEDLIRHIAQRSPLLRVLRVKLKSKNMKRLFWEEYHEYPSLQNIEVLDLMSSRKDFEWLVDSLNREESPTCIECDSSHSYEVPRFARLRRVIVPSHVKPLYDELSHKVEHLYRKGISIEFASHLPWLQEIWY